MRTFKMIIDPTKNKKDAAFCQYFKTNTADSKCMYNTANFYIRNTMTGLKKSPEERTHLETEVLHYVFTGIQKANEIIGQKNMKKKFAELKLAEVGGMNSAVIAFLSSARSRSSIRLRKNGSYHTGRLMLSLNLQTILYTDA